MPGDDHDLDAPGVEHHRRAHVHLDAGRGGPEVAEASVRDELDPPRDLERLSGHVDGRHVDLAAEHHRRARSDAGRDELTHGARVVDREHRHVLEFRLEDRPKHRH